MKRLIPLVFCLILVCALALPVSAAEVDGYYDDFNDGMDSMEKVEFPSIEEIRAYLDDLFNLDALQQAGDALSSLFTSPYVERVFTTAALFGLISLVLFGHK